MSGPLYKANDRGEPMLSIDAMGLLFGVTGDEIRESMREQGAPEKPWVIPPEWIKQGRRIARESMAATGSTSLKDSIDHLAANQ